MTDLSERLPAPPRFDAVLYPNRSLGQAGFAVLMAAIVLASGLVGAGFALIGAWPVTGFLGLDVLLLYLAFRWNYRDGRRADIIRLDPTGLHVRRITPGGRHQDWHFATAWVQVVAEDRGLMLRSHGQDLVIGAFLNEAERRAFADALRAAIRAHRDGASG